MDIRDEEVDILIEISEGIDTLSEARTNSSYDLIDFKRFAESLEKKELIIISKKKEDYLNDVEWNISITKKGIEFLNTKERG